MSSTPPPQRPHRWISLLALLLALVAVGVAVGAWFRPIHVRDSSPVSPTTIYSNEQITNAKASVCGAYGKVHRALVLSSERNGGTDATASLVVATSGRQVLEAGSRYLLTKLLEEPATPSELAAAVKKLADTYQEMVIGYLDGLTNSDAELQPLLQTSDDATSTIERLCK